MSVARRAIPMILLIIGAALLLAGLLAHSQVQGGYVSPHPWADFVTLGIILWAFGLFEAARRVLTRRGMPPTTVAVVGLSLSVLVAMVVGGLLFLVILK